MDNEKVPAFPLHPAMRSTAKQSECEGMDLRDWFAGQALAGMAARQIVGGREKTLASVAYKMADAMLAARKEDSHAG